jgi:hypothetical protein
MKIVFTYQFQRQNQYVPFYQESPEFLQYVNDKYIKTGKCLVFREKIISDDGLMQEIHSEWKNMEESEDFWNDGWALTVKNEIINYNKTHNIITINPGDLKLSSE